MSQLRLSLLFSAFACASAQSSTQYQLARLSTGVTLSVAVAGPPVAKSAGVILFLHGFPEGSWSWNAVFGSLAGSNYTLVAPDQRGYNKSSIPSGVQNYNVSLLSADIAALITEWLQVDHVHLVAHDWGGVVAFFLANEFPSLVKSLTISNAPHPQGWASGIRADAAQQQSSTYVLDFVNPAFTQYFLANGCAAMIDIFVTEAWFPAQQSTFVAEWQLPGAVDAQLNWYRANVRPFCDFNCTSAECWSQGFNTTFDDMQRGGAIDAPMLALWGMQDGAFDNKWQLGYMAAKAGGGFSLVAFENNTHWLPQEAPAQVAAHLLAFIQQLDAAARAP